MGDLHLFVVGAGSVGMDEDEARAARRRDRLPKLLVNFWHGGRSMVAAQLLSQENIKCINISDGFEGNSESSGWKNENLPSKVVDLNT